MAEENNTEEENKLAQHKELDDLPEADEIDYSCIHVFNYSYLVPEI